METAGSGEMVNGDSVWDSTLRGARNRMLSLARRQPALMVVVLVRLGTPSPHTQTDPPPPSGPLHFANIEHMAIDSANTSCRYAGVKETERRSESQPIRSAISPT